VWKRLLNRVFNTSLFYGGWFLCLKEAAEENSFYGLFVILLIILYHLYRSAYRKADSLILFLVTLIGPLSDTLYSQLGILKYNHPQTISSLPPIWIFFLWGLFAANLNLFSWLKKRWILATLFGAFGGPVSYLSAIRMGGAQLMKPLPIACLVIGGIWAFFLPTLIWLNQHIKNRMI
jgi:hypothetical protein